MREEVCGGEVGGDHARDRLRLHFLYSLLPMTSQYSLETDAYRFSILSHCFAAIGESVFFFFVLQCHILPCSSLNFLIEKMYYGCLFFFGSVVGFYFILFFFLCDQF